MIEDTEFITDEDRVVLLKEGIAVLGVQLGGRFPGIMVSAPDAIRAREFVAERLGFRGDVWVCGDVPREVKARPCVGYMEREPRRLQVRFVLSGDQHIDEIVVAEDDDAVVVLGTVCVSVCDGKGDHVDSAQIECPAHVWLRRPLGKRAVIDGFNGEPVPYKNVWTHIQARIEEDRAHPQIGED